LHSLRMTTKAPLRLSSAMLEYYRPALTARRLVQGLCDSHQLTPAMVDNAPGALRGYRVLDLCDDRGLFCGRILADLGADVVQVEPPGGSRARRIGPFYHDLPHTEGGLFWQAYAANKRSITLDLTTPDGHDLLLRLVAGAHFLIESFGPGCMDSWGLGSNALQRANPSLIMASVSPFGDSGPYSRFLADDIVLQGMGGLMYPTGEPERPPVRVSAPQAYLNASAEAAVGCLLAHCHREATGQGQHVDVSAQQAMVWTLMDAQQTWDVNHVVLKRAGIDRLRGSTGVRLRNLWRSQDGWVCYSLHGGPMGLASNRALVSWMAERGSAPDFLKQYDWSVFDWGTVTQQEADRLYEPISHFFLGHTKETLYREARRRGFLLYPVLTITEIVTNPQLAARDFFSEVQPAVATGPLAFPGHFAKLSATPLAWRRPAPFLGEHNEDIYGGELGLTRQRLAALKAGGII